MVNEDWGGEKVAELEKVINGIECHRSGICDNDKTLCPYWNEESDCSKKMLADTLELLKDYAGLQERHRILVEKADDMYLMLKEQSQIVQCKDCKHGYKCEDSEFILCIHPFSDGHKHTEDWFCADGELAEQDVTI